MTPPKSIRLQLNYPGDGLNSENLIEKFLWESQGYSQLYSPQEHEEKTNVSEPPDLILGFLAQCVNGTFFDAGYPLLPTFTKILQTQSKQSHRNLSLKELTPRIHRYAKYKLYDSNMININNHRVQFSKQQPGRHSDDDGLLLEETKPKLKKPSLYEVIMINDDYTPMEFVVHILQSFFVMDREKATRVMLQVHTEGRAVCGIYTREVAETKVAQVIDYAQKNEHPLLCDIQAADEN
ncbi:MAG: ATP-dependent Clp protease adaptor protein ClpS [Cellvibrionaceae bacterium]|jgi:ATP-dependent Clp protease adaptor protein ClpS